MMVLSSIINRIEEEGHKPSDLQFQVVFGLLDVRNDRDVMTIVNQAQQYIQQLTGRQNNPNVKQWLDGITQLPVYYVTDEKTPQSRKKEAFARMYGRLLTPHSGAGAAPRADRRRSAGQRVAELMGNLDKAARRRTVSKVSIS